MILIKSKKALAKTSFSVAETSEEKIGRASLEIAIFIEVQNGGFTKKTFFFFKFSDEGKKGRQVFSIIQGARPVLLSSISKNEKALLHFERR